MNEKPFDLPEIEIVYLAGLFDGEGCVHISKYAPTGKALSPHYKLIVTVSNTNEAVIRHLHATFGGRFAMNSRRINQQPCYCWMLHSRQAASFLRMVFPFLRIKKEQAAVAISFQSQIFYGPKKLTPEIIEAREVSIQRLIELKGKQNRLQEV